VRGHPRALSLLVLLVVAVARAAAGDAALLPGTIVPKVICTAHPEQSYALYLPSAYTPEKRWPIIYIFDPAARGLLPTKIFKEAAEQYGYILATSNNAKNGPLRPEMEAAAALWDDTHLRLAIDNQRVYAAGFSGGARLASHIAETCKCLHGAFLSGAGFAVDGRPERANAFPVFLTAGFLDFNYGELVRLDDQLSSLNIPHFLRRFEGAHEWAPPVVWSEALAWMNLEAMKDKRLPRDDAAIAREFERFRSAAKEVEKGGDIYLAARAFRQAAEAFEGLTATDSLRERASDLEKNPWYHLGEKHEREDLSTEASLEGEILGLTRALREPCADRTQLQQQASERIVDLRNRALDEKKEEKKRVLERARRGVFAALIESGEPLIDQKRLAQAEAYLALAVEARPEIPWPYLSLARCLLLMGRKKDALDSLERAKGAGLTAQELADLLTEVPEFRALAGDLRFQKLVEGKQPATEAR